MYFHWLDGFKLIACPRRGGLYWPKIYLVPWHWCKVWIFFFSRFPVFNANQLGWVSLHRASECIIAEVGPRLWLVRLLCWLEPGPGPGMKLVPLVTAGYQSPVPVLVTAEPSTSGADHASCAARRGASPAAALLLAWLHTSTAETPSKVWPHHTDFLDRFSRTPPQVIFSFKFFYAFRLVSMVYWTLC